MHIKISTISFLIVQTTAGFDPEPSIFIPKRPVGTMCFDIESQSPCRHALQAQTFVHELGTFCAKLEFFSDSDIYVTTTSTWRTIICASVAVFSSYLFIAPNARSSSAIQCIFAPTVDFWGKQTILREHIVVCAHHVYINEKIAYFDRARCILHSPGLPLIFTKDGKGWGTYLYKQSQAELLATSFFKKSRKFGKP